MKCSKLLWGPDVKPFSDGGRRSNKKSGLSPYALFSRLGLRCNRGDHRQNWEWVHHNRRRVTVCQDANSAAVGGTRRGYVYVSCFQLVKNQNQQYAAQRDPAPDPARSELSSICDICRPFCLAPDRNIAHAFPGASTKPKGAT